ncbi:MAG: LLM class flavin-dependent oxidoreductase, partial [Candidatus Bathyarchaeia archaeon]
MQRVGVSLPSRNVDLNELTSHATLADRTGYDSLWIPESWGHEVFTVLQKIADATNRIKLGPGIANV